MKIVNDPEERRRLRALNEKIKLLLIEHDVVGYVELHAKNSSDYLMHIEASWSCVHFEPKQADGSVIVRFKAAMKTGGPAEKERANWTMGMFLSMSDSLRKQKDAIDGLIVGFARHMGSIEHINQECPEPPHNE